MRAAVTTGPNAMSMAEVPSRPGRGPAEFLVRPEAVGLCGSDFHYFHGHLGGAFPRVQGHEFSAIVEAAGEDCPPALAPGRRVAVGRCPPAASATPARSAARTPASASA